MFFKKKGYETAETHDAMERLSKCVVVGMHPKQYLKELKNKQKSSKNGVHLMLYINDQCFTWTYFVPKESGVKGALMIIAQSFISFLFRKYGIDMQRKEQNQ